MGGGGGGVTFFQEGSIAWLMKCNITILFVVWATLTLTAR